MAQDLVDPNRQLVQQCRRIQVARFEVRTGSVANCMIGYSHLIRGMVLTIPRADDLIPEESEVVLLAIKRLPPKEAYDRVFRMRRAFQVRH